MAADLWREQPIIASDHCAASAEMAEKASEKSSSQNARPQPLLSKIHKKNTTLVHCSPATAADGPIINKTIFIFIVHTVAGGRGDVCFKTWLAVFLGYLFASYE
jgi:hypothetical protein